MECRGCMYVCAYVCMYKSVASAIQGLQKRNSLIKAAEGFEFKGWRRSVLSFVTLSGCLLLSSILVVRIQSQRSCFGTARRRNRVFVSRAVCTVFGCLYGAPLFRFSKASKVFHDPWVPPKVFIPIFSRCCWSPGFGQFLGGEPYAVLPTDLCQRHRARKINAGASPTVDPRGPREAWELQLCLQPTYSLPY